MAARFSSLVSFLSRAHLGASSLCLAGTLLAQLGLSGCGTNHHDAEPDAADLAAPEAAVPEPDAAAVPEPYVDAAPSDAGEPDAGDAPAPPDASLAQATFPLGGSACSPSRPGIAVSSARRVLITTGCGFFAVDTVANKVVQLEAQGDDIDDDGKTVAVLAGMLGLSNDGGETFEWTDWSLGRCQGTPRVRAGDGFAVVSCVAGVGRWRGKGSTFETLSPSGSSPIAAATGAGGSRLVIQETHGWFDSSDRGDSFHQPSIEGLPERVQFHDMELTGSTLWVPAQSSTEDSTALYAAAAGSTSFMQVSAFTERGAFSLRYSDGVLVVAGVRTYLSADQGATFTEAKLQPEAGFGPVATSYAAGHVYRVVDDTLYVDAVRP
jgi:hypothetical protein